ncbi:SCP-like extracellular [Paenibacillus oenotherae]|uniref:SCP-like extracellular n=1 Tax=Paenibacillus oenotherae TaxID=1435645 RepID=A0ABS7D784_9BACL|nr:SCP-like extracellular [Paenibacillus oenotherae]
MIAIAAALLLGALFAVNYNTIDKDRGPTPDRVATPGPTVGQASSTTLTPKQSTIRAKQLPGNWTDLLPYLPITNNPGTQNRYNPGTPNTNNPGTQNRYNPGTPNTNNPAGNNNQSNQPATSSSQFEKQVLDLVNQARSSAGLNALTMDQSLSNVAMAKAKDMHNNNYFDHNSPTYGSPFEMMKKFGISYSYAGENIAKGQQSAQQVMNDWMNSPGHRANILNSNYTKIGIAYYSGEWVQEFTG